MEAATKIWIYWNDGDDEVCKDDLKKLKEKKLSAFQVSNNWACWWEEDVMVYICDNHGKDKNKIIETIKSILTKIKEKIRTHDIEINLCVRHFFNSYKYGRCFATIKKEKIRELDLSISESDVCKEWEFRNGQSIRDYVDSLFVEEQTIREEPSIDFQKEILIIGESSRFKISKEPKKYKGETWAIKLWAKGAFKKNKTELKQHLDKNKDVDFFIFYHAQEEELKEEVEKLKDEIENVKFIKGFHHTTVDRIFNILKGDNTQEIIQKINSIYLGYLANIFYSQLCTLFITLENDMQALEGAKNNLDLGVKHLRDVLKDRKKNDYVRQLALLRYCVTGDINKSNVGRILPDEYDINGVEMPLVEIIPKEHKKGKDWKTLLELVGLDENLKPKGKSPIVEFMKKLDGTITKKVRIDKKYADEVMHFFNKKNWEIECSDSSVIKIGSFHDWFCTIMNRLENLRKSII